MRFAAAPAFMVLLMSLAQPVGAQRRSAASSDNTVRAELAAVLLQTRRYDEAIREYRVLVASQPANFAYRLGLARALAWGKRARDAEYELRFLRAQRPHDPEIAALLRSVRQGFEPDAQEAAGWLAEQPGFLPYRRALARALVREGRAENALPHFEILLASDTAILREAVAAQIDGGQPLRAAQLLRRALQTAPRDTALRHSLAVALTRAQQLEAARAQYDTLLVRQSTPALLLERAQLHASLRAVDAARADAHAAIRAGANAGAYRLLGDLHRAQGELAQARVSYSYARLLQPDDPELVTAAAQVAREERPVVAFLPAWQEPTGWLLRSTSISDNEGMSYATAGVRRIDLLPLGLQGSVDVELRRLAEQFPALGDGAGAAAFSLGLARELAYGPFLARVGGNGGIAVQSNAAQWTGALTVTGWLHAWALSLERAGGPAYPSLLTRAAIDPPESAAQPLTEQVVSAALGGPLGLADIALNAQRAALSDGNTRMTVQTVFRAALNTRLRLLSAGTGVWFAERSTNYWDPISFQSITAGLELAQHQARGLSFALRALAGPARVVEELPLESGDTRTVRQVALQLSAGGELIQKSDKGELSASVTYGSARAGGYRRLEISLHARAVHNKESGADR